MYLQVIVFPQQHVIAYGFKILIKKFLKEYPRVEICIFAYDSGWKSFFFFFNERKYYENYVKE